MALLRGPESKRAAERLGWDSSQVSRFLSGDLGIKREQLNTAIELSGKDLIDVDEHLLLVKLASKALGYECARLTGR